MVEPGQVREERSTSANQCPWTFISHLERNPHQVEELINEFRHLFITLYMGTRTQRLTSAGPGSIQRANMQDVAWQDLLGVVYDQLVGASVCILCDAMAVVAVSKVCTLACSRNLTLPPDSQDLTQESHASPAQCEMAVSRSPQQVSLSEREAPTHS